MLLSEKKFGQALIKEGFLNEKQILAAYEHQIIKKVSLKDAILDLELLSEDELNGAIITVLGVASIRLKDYQIDRVVIDKIPPAQCKIHKIIPVSLVGNVLTIATADPLNIIALDELTMLTNCEITPVLAREADIMEAITKYYSQQIKIDQIITSTDTDSKGSKKDEIEINVTPDTVETAAVIDETPIIKLANHIIAAAVRKGASDIHIEPRPKQMGVRYRIDGVLVEQEPLPKSIQLSFISRIKIMAKLDIAEKRLPQDGQIKIVFESREIDLRVSTLPIKYGEKVVIRILDKGALRLNLDELDIPEKYVTQIKKALDLPYGLILATGPTGSGKTTTLYAGLNYLNSPVYNLVTVEDPVEYELPVVNQVQVNADIGLTFVNALKYILRQDPDVIMIGEIRDKETLDIAMKSSLTGHMVLSTIHTNDAPTTITRLFDMGGEPYLIASALELVVAQRLIRRLCEFCKESYPMTQELLQYFKDMEPPKQLFRAPGCSHCNGTGTKGRIAVLELMAVTEPIKRLISQSATASAIKQKALELGMPTLRQYAMTKVAAGIISMDEALQGTI
ncbi:MAG: Flp pilus assembly complex ATPase component TadA [Planctomycetes bacterium]|nr:Flp pilus assembly complex ATPase component TadA [Planctomycetota bacterium]